ncbi:Afadin and alpha-actinin-binding-domain-containing protein, partial [Abortiporus biennis]
MDSTPKKPGVHWALDSSISDFGSPFIEGSSNESVSTSTSTLQYVNSQLISHGFTQNPGLSLDGLQKEDSERVMKCLMGMLGQRIEDLSRTEDFGAKIRTLSYEHERLTSMYKTVNDKALNAEREANSHKSKLASANQALQVSEMAHKRTTGELQRLRTSLQGLRETHKAELKKIEKEKDRMSERWNKLSDAQLKIGATVPSGIKFANQQVVEASDVQIRGKGKGFLEVSLEEAERSRKELAEQNRELKRIVLSAANDLQRIFWSAQNLTSSGSSDEPPPLTATALFPMTSLMVASTKMNSLLNNLKGLAERLAQENMIIKSSISIAQHPSLTLDSKSKNAPDRVDVERLKAEVGKLQQELEESRRQADNQATEAQALFDRFSGDKRLLNAEIPSEISVNLITTPSRDEELERLENRARQLEQERAKFTEASVKLGKEKAALEEERIRFLEEKRQWQVQQMLSDLPPTPPAEESVQPQHPRPPVDPSILLPRSPRKSPHKAKLSSSGLKSSPKPKKTRVSRRSSGLIPLSPKSKNIIPSYETEVIPSYPLPVPNFKTTLTFEPSSPNSLKAFVLPPPSPAAKIGGSPEVDKLLAPLPKVDFGSAFATTSELQPSLSDGQPVSATSIPSSGSSDFPASTSSSGYSASSSSAVSSALQVPVPSTPLSNRPFPMAKPLASRMIHAYSPAKPSPLSRILMLANSPESPDNEHSSGASSLDAVLEEDEDDT